MPGVRPLRFEDGALLVLDQRALPAEERWLRCERVEEVAEAIRSMAVRGAPAIGLAAAYGLALSARAGVPFEEAASLLLSTRPTAANLGWAIERARTSDEDPLDFARSLAAGQLEADRGLAALGPAR